MRRIRCHTDHAGRPPSEGTSARGRYRRRMSIRVFVLDDHELVRTGLRTLLEAEDDMEVVGEAGDGRSRA